MLDSSAFHMFASTICQASILCFIHIFGSSSPFPSLKPPFYSGLLFLPKCQLSKERNNHCGSHILRELRTSNDTKEGTSFNLPNIVQKDMSGATYTATCLNPISLRDVAQCLPFVAMKGWWCCNSMAPNLLGPVPWRSFSVDQMGCDFACYLHLVDRASLVCTAQLLTCCKPVLAHRLRIGDPCCNLSHLASQWKLTKTHNSGGCKVDYQSIIFVYLFECLILVFQLCWRQCTKKMTQSPFIFNYSNTTR